MQKEAQDTRPRGRRPAPAPRPPLDLVRLILRPPIGSFQRLTWCGSLRARQSASGRPWQMSESPVLGPHVHGCGGDLHRRALQWSELFPVFPVDLRLFPVPPGTEKPNDDNGLRAFSGFVPGVPGKSGRHPEGNTAKGTPPPDLVRVDSAAQAGEFGPLSWGVMLSRPVNPSPLLGPSGPSRVTGHSERVAALVSTAEKG